jgi:hypothetical protein
MHAHEWRGWWEAFVWPLHLQNLITIFGQHLRDRWVIVTRAEEVTVLRKDLGRLLTRTGVRPVMVSRRHWGFSGARLERLHRFEPQIRGGDFCWVDTPTDPRERPLPKALGRLIGHQRQPPAALDGLGSSLACVLHDDDLLDLYIRGRRLRHVFLSSVVEYFMKNRWSESYFDNASDRYLRRVREVQFSTLPATMLARIERHMETTGLYCSVDELAVNGSDLCLQLWKGVPGWPRCRSFPKLERVNRRLELRYTPATARWNLSPVMKATWPYDPRTGNRRQEPAASGRSRPA